MLTHQANKCDSDFKALKLDFDNRATERAHDAGPTIFNLCKFPNRLNLLVLPKPPDDSSAWTNIQLVLFRSVGAHRPSLCPRQEDERRAVSCGAASFCDELIQTQTQLIQSPQRGEHGGGGEGGGREESTVKGKEGAGPGRSAPVWVFFSTITHSNVTSYSSAALDF